MKIPILNLYYLLSYAWNKLEEAEFVPVGQIDKDNAQNLFGRILASSTFYLIKRGLDRDYIEMREETRIPKGKINMTSTVQKNLLREMRVDCSYDELSYNILHNRILKSTIGNLTRLKDLHKETGDKLNLCYRKLNEVEEIEIRKDLFRRLQFNRNNYFYDFLMKICELIYDNLLLDEKGEHSKFKDFVQDPVQMGHLFESFVGNFYRVHKDEHGFDIRTSKPIFWDAKPRDEYSLNYLPQMKADIVLSSDERKIVMDTKFYEKTLQEYYDKKTLHSNNLYQIFSYLKNLEKEGTDWEDCEGVLLYPTTDDSFPGAEYEIQGHNISVKTINLNQDWQNIHSDLIALVA